MPLIKPTSSNGRTSGRQRLKIKNISAVQRPIPRICINSAMTVSSSIVCQFSATTRLALKCSAKSSKYSALRFDKPQPRNCSGPACNTCAGVVFGHSNAKRCHVAAADLIEICCPTTERAKVTKGSRLLTKCKSPNCGISLLMIRSRSISSVFARDQYSGTSIFADFMHNAILCRLEDYPPAQFLRPAVPHESRPLVQTGVLLLRCGGR